MSSEAHKLYGHDFLHMMEGVMGAKDARVVAILPCSFLEVHLTTLIERKLPGLSDQELWQKFFGSSGFAIDMARKIDLAVASAAIDGNLAKRIIKIARIRNRFAHRLHVNDFEHIDIAPLVDSLASQNTPAPQIMTEDGLKPLLDDDRRGRFIREAISACGKLVDIAVGEAFKYTDETTPAGTPGTLRSISFGPSRSATEDPDPTGR